MPTIEERLNHGRIVGQFTLDKVEKLVSSNPNLIRKSKERDITEILMFLSNLSIVLSTSQINPKHFVSILEIAKESMELILQGPMRKD